MNGWACTHDATGDVHVHPVNDARGHILSMECWCGPTGEFRVGCMRALWVHNSADEREAFETGRRKPS